MIARMELTDSTLVPTLPYTPAPHLPLITETLRTDRQEAGRMRRLLNRWAQELWPPALVIVAGVIFAVPAAAMIGFAILAVGGC